ncbi:hypothetical protein ETI08_01135 [Macrococcoides goetzii]|nr:hypothetical protein [Macrococcus goetzii]TDM47767.1 hypothetical protein ETI08_01135 [Macrococcus goetzii]
MIKVGDKFNFEEDEWTVIDVSEYDDTLIARTKDGDDYVFFQSTVYQFFYEQQKQRADELEKDYDKVLSGYIHVCNEIRKEKLRADELEKNLNLINSSQDNLVNELQQALSESNKRADRAEKRWSELKEHSNDVWMNGDADEHEYAFNVLKLMQQLEEDGE